MEGVTIACYHLVSAQPGLVPHARVYVIHARLWEATVFVDYAITWVRAHLIQSLRGDATVEAKDSFEQN